MKGLQLPLGVQLADRATLDSFFAGPNHEAVAAVRTLPDAGPPVLLLYGAAGSGKSHLLQALTARAAERCAVGYVPLRQLAGEGPEALDGMDALDLVCVDDLDAIAGQPDWMVALLRLLDRLRSHGARCLLSASAAPERLELGLPDLVTRVSGGATYGLKPLNDADRQRLLHERALQRGLQLAEDASRLLLAQLPRDTGSLLDALDRLDRDSLSAQRRLSLPFVADWLRHNAPAPAKAE